MSEATGAFDVMVERSVILSITAPNGETHEVVLGEGDHFSLTVPPRRTAKTYRVMVVQVAGA